MTVDPKDALYYMGVRSLDDSSKGQSELIIEAESVIEEYAKILNGSHYYRLFDIEKSPDFISLKPLGQAFYSASLASFLKNCGKCFLLYATLGYTIDAEIIRLQKTDMKKAVILDACASAALEAHCDALMMELKGRAGGAEITDRFSPGFGDLDLKENARVLKILDAHKRAGIVQNAGGLMSPLKTVTAFTGVSEKIK